MYTWQSEGFRAQLLEILIWSAVVDVLGMICSLYTLVAIHILLDFYLADYLVDSNIVESQRIWWHESFGHTKVLLAILTHHLRERTTPTSAVSTYSSEAHAVGDRLGLLKGFLIIAERYFDGRVWVSEANTAAGVAKPGDMRGSCWTLSKAFLINRGIQEGFPRLTWRT